MAIASWIKDPAAILDYQIDWSEWLSGTTITISTWVVPAGITKVTDSNTTTVAIVRLSGGTHGQNYECVNHITTANGQQDERSLLIRVRQAEAGATADATDRANGLLTLNDWVAINAAPVLTQTELENILARCQRAARWTSSTTYLPNDVVIPTTRNGHRYRALVGGQSGTTEPTWPDDYQDTLSEGISNPILTWIEDGPDYSNVYDLRLAAYEAWALKERKASQFMQTGDLAFGDVYQHCREQRMGFDAVRIG